MNAPMPPKAWYLPAALLLGTACHLVGGTDGLYIDDGSGGTSPVTTSSDGTTSTSSSGAGASTSSAGGSDGGGFGMGGQPECTMDADCDDSDATTCAFPRCINSVCTVVNAEFRSPCTEDGGNVCAGSECVECVEQEDCPPGSAACTNQFCVATGCDSGTQDGGETDIDCGGPCAPCGNTQGCAAQTDCLSGFCDGTTCAACSGHGDCGGDRYCEPVTQVCKNRRGLFSGCDNGFECNSNSCCWPGWCC